MWNEPAGLGESPPLSQEHWLSGGHERPANWEDSHFATTSAPPVSPAYGMSAEQLARYQRRFSTYARLRLLGTGKREYGKGNRQAFEDMSLHRLIDEAVDELADLVNYATMIAIQFQRLKTDVEDIA
jgi:hypothetical protein